ncbi:hypothetical protein [Nocardia sp. NPDC020380]|uniref:hypothetical protein n=1 Tax=Nocardia sp. NPDC020380 TaxID=3364309 RepID=UPI0037B738B2
MAPDGQRLVVDLQKMLVAQQKWQDAGIKLLNASVKAQNTVNVDPNQVGLFHEFFGTYKLVPQYAYDRLSEGLKACGAISATLKSGHDAYQQQDDANRDSFTGLN